MSYLLTINSGSSSLKFSLYDPESDGAQPVSGRFERIGLVNPVFNVAGKSQPVSLPDHDAALHALFGWLEARGLYRHLRAVGHRVVYGGREYEKPEIITPKLIERLRELVPFAPDHLPRELDAIQAIHRAHSGLPQVACFDTAFHARSPKIAKLYPLPRHYFDEGLIRYGFHGLSYAYILQELVKLRRASAGARIIVAHLGNGASMAAIRGVEPIDTTMGLTPCGGMMMSSRCGDLDPGVVLSLIERGLSSPVARRLFNEQSGLLGVSEISSDMQDLLAMESDNLYAAEAIALFCYEAKKSLGLLAAVLGGVDTLVFTAGIGENAASIRSRICAGLEFIGIQLDPGRNEANAPVISAPKSASEVRVIKTNEEIMIARYTDELTGGKVHPIVS
ncbi:MAG TPA: acetate/propionate family kinase [Bryobacteraceae bacterium]|jgi:acetate kinase|nr:acetate/propionate family kinase [Bryobacteraceae bacterium]